MNPFLTIQRKPIRRWRPKRKDADPAYLEWITSLPCVVCVDIVSRLAGPTLERIVANSPLRRFQEDPTEAHHAGDHGLAQRAPDRTAIPLCTRHHRESRDSAHKLGKAFWQQWGIDRDALIRKLNEEYDAAQN
jgi:hypothetical protein